MVSVLVFSVIVVAILGALLIGKQSWQTGETQLELQQETRKGMARMVAELRQSGVSYAPEYPAQNMVIAVAGTNNTIIFRQAQGWDNTNVRVDWVAERITYALGGANNDKLIRTTINDAGTTTSTDVLANRVQSLQFTRNSDVVDILLQVQKDSIPGRTMQSTLFSRVRLRN
jgi:type II secretory pathway pseudopilin PulG